MRNKLCLGLKLEACPPKHPNVCCKKRPLGFIDASISEFRQFNKSNFVDVNFLNE
jgi:hypothetical protein